MTDTAPAVTATEKLPYEAYSKGYWRGVAAVEGTETGDGRMFAPNSLVWRDLPLPMYWQEKTAEGHDASYVVGRIDELVRDGNLIRDSGRFDMGGEHGREAHRLAYEGMIRGQSVSLDDISDNDIEMVWPEEALEPEPSDTDDPDDDDPDDLDDPDDANDPDEEDEEDMPLDALFVSPEMVIFHHGRIMDVNFTGNPAMQEAYLELIPDAEIDGETPDDAPVDDEDVIVAAIPLSSRSQFRAVASHDTPTTDGPWDGGENEKRLKSPFSVAIARDAYAWIDESSINNDMIPRSSCRFIHHEVSGDGTPGAANLTACSSAIGVLNGARGGSTIPAADRQAVYNHLANHIRDGGREPPELLSIQEVEMKSARRRLTAATMPVAPPRSWFENPRFAEATPWTVEDSGQVFGHMALRGTCHTGFTGTCVTPPMEKEYSFFTTGEVVCDDGSRVPVGHITLGTGHAPTTLGVRPAIEHYDNTGYVAADVAIGTDRFGIWVAGAARPELTPHQMRAVRAAAISGDWRSVRGRLRLIGALMVNVPGFPIPRTRTYARDGQQTALVASGVVVRPTIEVSASVADIIARSIGRDHASRMASIRASVHPSIKE